jgi:membrane dipeptidase
MGPCFYGKFIAEKKPTLDRYVDHLLHALEVMGPDHVGIGTDFDGVSEGAYMAIPDPSRLDRLWAALDRRGVDRPTQRKIAHDNFLRLLPE